MVNCPVPFLSNDFNAAGAFAISVASMMPSWLASNTAIIGGGGRRIPRPGPPCGGMPSGGPCWGPSGGGFCGGPSCWATAPRTGRLSATAIAVRCLIFMLFLFVVPVPLLCNLCSRGNQLFHPY